MFKASSRDGWSGCELGFHSFLQLSWKGRVCADTLEVGRKSVKPTYLSLVRPEKQIQHSRCPSWDRLALFLLVANFHSRKACFRGCPEVVFGCISKRDALQALVPMGIANSKGHFICSLDYSQAFDRVRWEKALKVLRSRVPMCVGWLG